MRAGTSPWCLFNFPTDSLIEIRYRPDERVLSRVIYSNFFTSGYRDEQSWAATSRCLRNFLDALPACYRFHSIQMSRISILVCGDILAGCLMFSCGLGQAPKELTVGVPHDFSGSLHIHVCDKTARENNIAVDDIGEGSTSMCLEKDDRVQLRIIGQDRREIIPANLVTITRTGDGIATVVEAKIQAN
jgi:hypothetical protein